jgi:hypothetical protein
VDIVGTFDDFGCEVLVFHSFGTDPPAMQGTSGQVSRMTRIFVFVVAVKIWAPKFLLHTILRRVSSEIRRQSSLACFQISRSSNFSIFNRNPFLGVGQV